MLGLFVFPNGPEAFLNLRQKGFEQNDFSPNIVPWVEIIKHCCLAIYYHEYTVIQTQHIHNFMYYM